MASGNFVVLCCRSDLPLTKDDNRLKVVEVMFLSLSADQFKLENSSVF